MAASVAELSSLITQVRELSQRVTDAAEGLNTPESEPMAAALFDAERGLRSALRALERAQAARS